MDLDAYLKDVILLTKLFRNTILTFQFSSVQLLSCLSLWPHGLQHARLPCPSPTPGAYSNSCPLSQWCYSTISSSVVPFSFHLQSFPASGYFPMRQFFASGGQSTGVPTSTSVLPVNTQDWSPLGWTGWISLQSKGLSRVFSNTTVQKHQFFSAQLSLHSNSHIHTWPLATIALTRQTFVGKVMSLLFNMLSRLVITFLPRSKGLSVSWLQSPSAVIFGDQKDKVCYCFLIYLPWSDGTRSHDLSFWMINFFFSLPSFTFIRSLFSSSSLSAIKVVSSAHLRLLIFLPAILIPACASSSPAFLMMYSAYKLNKQGDKIQLWRTAFPIWNQSVVPCPVLTVASWPAYRFLKRQIRWSGILISLRIFQFVVVHTVKGFGIYWLIKQTPKKGTSI